MKAFNSIIVPCTKQHHSVILFDNAPPHRGKKFITYCKRKKIETVGLGGFPLYEKNGFPPNSPDLNPVENLFSYTDQRINKNRYKTLEELIQGISDTFSSISQNFLRKLIKKQIKNVKWVADNNGRFSE